MTGDVDVTCTPEQGNERSHTKRTGPRTRVGKERSRRNALKHGIFSRLVLDGAPFHESTEDCAALLASLRRAIRPVNDLEDVLVDKLALAFVRLARVYRADAAFAKNLFARATQAVDKENKPIIREFYLEKSDAVFLWTDQAPDLLLKYETSIEKTIDRTMQQLKLLEPLRSANRG